MTKKKTTKKAVKKTASAKKTKKTSAPATSATVKRSGVTDVADNKKATPIVFSLDDVEAFMASKKKKSESAKDKDKDQKKSAVKKTAPVKKTVAAVEDKPAEKRVLGAASLADILGFNPAEKKKVTNLEEDSIPKKWIKFYRLLIDLRNHVSEELSLHTSDTLKHSSREESDISGYGNHQADAATDSFDRDFALSLVSNEQDALNEVEAAIQRIKHGSYGVCEITGKDIPKERLAAVPFARFSVQGQAEYEKNKRRKINRDSMGIFGDTSDTPKLITDEDD